MPLCYSAQKATQGGNVCPVQLLFKLAWKSAYYLPQIPTDTSPHGAQLFWHTASKLDKYFEDKGVQTFLF